LARSSFVALIAPNQVPATDPAGSTEMGLALTGTGTGCGVDGTGAALDGIAGSTTLTGTGWGALLRSKTNPATPPKNMNASTAKAMIAPAEERRCAYGCPV
jgi:hypothetical protein